MIYDKILEKFNIKTDLLEDELLINFNSFVQNILPTHNVEKLVEQLENKKIITKKIKNNIYFITGDELYDIIGQVEIKNNIGIIYEKLIEASLINYETIDNTSLIEKYYDKNIFYIIYVGLYKCEHLFKYGNTDDIYRSYFLQDKNNFPIFDLVYIMETDNDRKIKKIFEKEIKYIYIHRDYNTTEYKSDQLFAVNDKYTIDNIINLADKIIKENPLDNVSCLTNICLKLQNQLEMEKLKCAKIETEYNAHLMKIKRQEEIAEMAHYIHAFETLPKLKFILTMKLHKVIYTKIKNEKLNYNINKIIKIESSIINDVLANIIIDSSNIDLCIKKVIINFKKNWDIIFKSIYTFNNS